MSLEKKLLEEVKRYNNINHYIKEQDELPPLPGEGEETTDELPAAPEGGEDTAVEEVPEPVDIDTDPEVEVVGDEDTTDDLSSEEGTEELDVTELVTTQKDISDKQDEYMEGMFSKLEDLTSKLGEMDTILSKINDLEQ